MKRFFIHSALCSCLLLLLGCASDSHQDLRDFIAENKKRPPGKIKEAPAIELYEAFSYDAYRLRSPFDRPISVGTQQKELALSSNVKPDLSRQKERLEQYGLTTLSMVGTLKKQGQLWALIKDPEGAIERVRVGNYLGRNHGRITVLTEKHIDVLELVANGDGWLERPNVLSMTVAKDSESINQ